MTLYNHCGIPLAYNDERKPSFVRYEDYQESQAECEKWKRNAEQCRKELTEAIGRLYRAAID